MSKKYEKIYRIGLDLLNYPKEIIYRPMLKALISEHVGYNEMPTRNTLSIWVNRLVYNYFIEVYARSDKIDKSSYCNLHYITMPNNDTRYRINKAFIESCLMSYKTEQQKPNKEKSCTLPKTQPTLTNFFELAIAPKSNNRQKRNLKPNRASNTRN